MFSVWISYMRTVYYVSHIAIEHEWNAEEWKFDLSKVSKDW